MPTSRWLSVLTGRTLPGKPDSRVRTAHAGRPVQSHRIGHRRTTHHDPDRRTLLRVRVASGGLAGLDRDSDIMIDKLTTIRRANICHRVGRLATDQLADVERALMTFLGLARQPLKDPKPLRPRLEVWSATHLRIESRLIHRPGLSIVHHR